MYTRRHKEGRELPCYSTVEGAGLAKRQGAGGGVSGTSSDFQNGPQDSAHREEGRAAG